MALRRAKLTCAHQGIVGKESAKVGQGKAFKEGWVKKDKAGLLHANVSCGPMTSLTSFD